MAGDPAGEATPMGDDESVERVRKRIRELANRSVHPRKMPGVLAEEMGIEESVARALVDRAFAAEREAVARGLRGEGEFLPWLKSLIANPFGAGLVGLGFCVVGVAAAGGSIALTYFNLPPGRYPRLVIYIPSILAGGAAYAAAAWVWFRLKGRARAAG